MEDGPCLLGRDVLRSRDIRSSELGRNYLRLHFDGKYKSIQPQKVQLKQNVRVGVANPEGENEVNKVSRDCPILWVKQNLDIDLPAHAPLEHRRLIEKDLKEFQAAFATSCSSLGEFPETAELPTVPGEVRNRKQIPIPQAQLHLADERHEQLKELNKLHRDEELYIWQHLVSLVSDRADIRDESSSKGDDTSKTKLKNTEISLPEKVSGTIRDVQKRSKPQVEIIELFHLPFQAS